ncbi:MAG: hypothetical protein GY886_06005 [Gammaproteobacteria bacterium]|nr:hypothetical protein [Gammaproteobacteria bacterium]
MNKSLILAASFFALFSTNAHAYIDPGTGSIAIQFLIGGLVAAGFMIKTYYYSLKNKLASIFGRSNEDKLSGSAPSGDALAGNSVSPDNSTDKT